MVESLGPINNSAASFLGVLGRRITDISGRAWVVSFFYSSSCHTDSTLQRCFTPWQLCHRGGRDWHSSLFTLCNRPNFCHPLGV